MLGFERAAGAREAFLCEGVFYWLTALAWRLPAFSPGGTSLPADRLGFLARARIVWGVFDGDAAGRAASARFREHLGERFQPLALPEGCDLNDLACRPDGRARFFRLLADTRELARAPGVGPARPGSGAIRAEMAARLNVGTRSATGAIVTTAAVETTEASQDGA